ncbi:hypothetical protein C6P86_11350 [Burkholderia multivorans]|nr:hypothetical protein C6P86_11350 [Burkholderia multivorans]PRE84661.1 hypothetical protein C6Q00_16200 [Burkholderia multivorans]
MSSIEYWKQMRKPNESLCPLHGLRRNAGADVVAGGRVHRERHANTREGHPIYLSRGQMSGQLGLVENRSRDRITTQE